MTTQGQAWDLSPLVPSTKLDDIKKLIEQHVEAAEQLAKEYKGKIASLSAKELRVHFAKSEEFYIELEGTYKFMKLSYDADSLDPVAKQVGDLARRMYMKINQILAFQEIELSHLVAAKPSLINHPELAEYKHALERAKRKAPHMLSDVEEQLILQKDRFGIDSWAQFQSDWLSTRTYDIDIEGEQKTITFAEMYSLAEHPNRDIRKSTRSLEYLSLGEDEILWASALRSVVGDHIETSKMRKYPSPRAQSLIDNDVDDETIDALMNTVEDNVKLFHRYLRSKAKIMGIKKLGGWDLVAPLPNMPDMKYDWKTIRQTVIATYQNFDADLAKIVQEMFDKRHIDSEVRKGKTGGAFFSPWYKGKLGYILQSFTGTLGDLYTMIHENGHAVHSYLMATNQTQVNTEIGMCIAEVGSVFGELLLTDKLLSEAKTKQEQLTILSRVLDGFTLSVFQISAYYFFEEDLYDAFNKGEYLDGETIAKYWEQSRDRIFANEVEWLPESKWKWTYVPHYYLPNFRFYNYPYIFAQLLVYALYRLYKEEGKEFVPKLKRILSSGSRYSPRELAAELGFDIASPKFWELGMKQAEEFIQEYEALTKD
ncbi:MAG: M3 family metallopeptidase [Candidatus Hodarchaeota archaeon]